MRFCKISNVSSQALIDLTQENKIARYFQKIIDLIDIFEWDRARSLWILAVPVELKPVNWKFSLFGLQTSFFVDKYLSFQELIFTCVDCPFFSNTVNEYYFKQNINGDLILNCSFEQACKGCKKMVLARFKFKPFGVFISIFDKISFTDLPPTVKILDKTFCLLCISFATTSNSVQHFKSLYYVQKSFYEVDDLYPNQLFKNLPQKPSISYCFYYLV